MTPEQDERLAAEMAALAEAVERMRHGPPTWMHRIMDAMERLPPEQREQVVEFAERLRADD